MGVFPSVMKPALEIGLYKGDTLLFYTDGVTEAHNENYEDFGEAP